MNRRFLASLVLGAAMAGTSALTGALQYFIGGEISGQSSQGSGSPIQMTVTGYPRVLESNVPETARAVDQIRALARRWGPRDVVWRYDPVVLSSLTDEPASF